MCFFDQGTHGSPLSRPEPEDFGPPTRALRARGRAHTLRRLTVPVLLVLLGWSVFYIWINSPARRTWLKSEAQAQLRKIAPAAELGQAFSVSPLGRVRMGPLWIARAREAEPWLYADSVEIRPSYRSLLTTHPQAAQVTLVGARLRGGNSRAELQESLRPLRERASTAASTAPKSENSEQPSLPRIAAHALTFGCSQLPRAPEKPTAACPRGPFEGLLVLDRPKGRPSLRAEVVPPGGGRARFVARPDGEGLKAELRIDGLEAKELLQGLLPSLSNPTTGGTVTARVDAQMPGRDLKRGSAELELKLEKFSFQGGQLAPEPFGPLGGNVRGTLRWELEKDPRFELKQLDLALDSGGARAELDGSLKLSGQAPLSATLRLLPVSFQALLDALPPSFRPAREAPQLKGELSGQLKLEGPLRAPRLLVVQGGLDLSRLKQAPATAGRRTLDGPFIYAPVDADGREREVLVGPDNPNFAPLDTLPPYLLSAVTVSEDAGFFAHRGFDFDEIKNSLVEAAEQGRLRGASTLTQQLAKNLFLSRERTLARKVREALVTVTLEAAVPKRRLLEIYLNMIEWGPRINGIGEAARHYFAKPPSALSVKEAAYLATIIPGPVRYYVYFQRGALTPIWERRVDELLYKMWHVGAIEQAAYDEALATPLRFTGGHSPAAPTTRTAIENVGAEPEDLLDSEPP